MGLIKPTKFKIRIEQYFCDPEKNEVKPGLPT